MNGAARVELQVRRNLIIPTPSRMQLATHITKTFRQRTFNVHMNVFEFKAKLELTPFNFLADLCQRLYNLLAFVIRNQTHLSQHACVRL